MSKRKVSKKNNYIMKNVDPKYTFFMLRDQYDPNSISDPPSNQEKCSDKVFLRL